MARGRALLTQAEREALAGEHGDNRKYEVVSRTRNRIEDELPKDIEALRKHHPQLLDELLEVCEQQTDELKQR